MPPLRRRGGIIAFRTQSRYNMNDKSTVPEELNESCKLIGKQYT